MPQVTFRFYSYLNDFLPQCHKQVAFVHRVKDQAAVKDPIEALGIPHPEVDLILANSQSVGFDYLLQENDFISVYPRFVSLRIDTISHVQPPPPEHYRFILDVHLGKLANYLRLLGFDVLYRNDYDDAQLAQIASQEQRVLLTQDVGLLKRRLVTYGYRVRSSDPKQQVREILDRFELETAIAPFQRCTRCNGLIAAVDKQTIYAQLPPLTRRYYDEFFQCQTCQQVYWKGAHFQQLQQLIAQFTDSTDCANVQATHA
jgi:hypothetical protein